ncbi:MAG TPA: hypothetical protein VK642_13580 [Burkholderiales bacterium]|nr:hypothetical protein [Burkholderiales bacterium]
MKTRISLAAGSVIALVLGAPVAAQTVSAIPKNAAAKTSGVQYTAGGVGLDARAEMQSLAASHNLLVKFAEGDGAYLIPDSISIRKGSADVLSVTDTGPLLYVNLPNGVYTVAATYKGVVRSKSVSVAGRAPDVVLTWPSQLN